MLERFDEEARRALAQAEREARALKHGYVGTEHLLLALMHEPECVAARALRLLGVNRRKARTRILKLVDVGSKRPEGSIAFTPRMKEIIEDAFLGVAPSVPGDPLRAASAKSCAPRFVLQKGAKLGSSDLLLALVAHGEGIAARVLGDLGVDLERAFVATTSATFPDAGLVPKSWPSSPVPDIWPDWPPGSGERGP